MRSSRVFKQSALNANSMDQSAAEAVIETLKDILNCL